MINENLYQLGKWRAIDMPFNGNKMVFYGDNDADALQRKKEFLDNSTPVIEGLREHATWVKNNIHEPDAQDHAKKQLRLLANA